VAAIYLFYLEDAANIIEESNHLIGAINDEKGSGYAEHTVVTNLADAKGLLDKDEGKGVENYTHFLFDISVPFHKRLRGEKVKTYGEDTGFAGLDFMVDYYERNEYFQAAVDNGRVGIISGHSIESYKGGTDNLSIICNLVKYFPKLVNNTNGKVKWLTGEEH